MHSTLDHKIEQVRRKRSASKKVVNCLNPFIIQHCFVGTPYTLVIFYRLKS